jgi:hypothetical protein
VRDVARFRGAVNPAGSRSAYDHGIMRRVKTMKPTNASAAIMASTTGLIVCLSLNARLDLDRHQAI